MDWTMTLAKSLEESNEYISKLQDRVKELERSLKVAESDRDTFKRYAGKMEPVVDAARALVGATALPGTLQGNLAGALRELDGEKKCGLCTDIKPCNFEACPDGQ